MTPAPAPHAIVRVEQIEPRTLCANLLPGFGDSLVAGGLVQPVAMAFAPDGRIFVTEKMGRVRVIKEGVLQPTPFTTLTVNSQGERGALGVTLDPDFADNGFVYLYHTATTPNLHNRVSRFTAVGDVADPASETVVLDLDPLSGAMNHNGGAIHFGPDGKLYVAQGDNNDGNKSQSLADRFGKILRINPDGSIPADNPFFDTASGDNRSIWALGLRNPFTFAFRAGDGRMFINDVGANSFEEINPGAAGANYGWPQQEGTPSSNPAFTNPVFFYGRPGTGNPGGTAITGGAFYDSAVKTFPTSYHDDYFFADLGGKFIWSFDTTTNTATEFATNLGSTVDLAVGPDGSLYYVSFGSAGQIRRISFTAPAPTQIVTQPQSVTVGTGQPATFTVTATGDDLSYQWFRGDLPLAGETGPSYTRTSAAPFDQNVPFRVLVRGADGAEILSGPATVTIDDSLLPTQIIQQPESVTVPPGQPVTFTSFAQGPGLVYQWQRDGVDIAGANQSTYTITETTLADSGAVFRLVVTGPNGTDVSDPAVLTVTENDAPRPTITSPREGQLFTAGRRVRFSGKAFDAEDGRLPASAFTWQVDRLQGDATNTVGNVFPQTTGVRNGSFVVSRDPTEIAVNSAFRVRLTVTDSGGRSTTTETIVRPRTVQLFVEPSVPGLAYRLDGGEPTTETVINAVAGTVRSLAADAAQQVDGVGYRFGRWSNTRQREFELVVPKRERTFRLMYGPTSSG